MKHQLDFSSSDQQVLFDIKIAGLDNFSTGYPLATLASQQHEKQRVTQPSLV